MTFHCDIVKDLPAAEISLQWVDEVALHFIQFCRGHWTLVKFDTGGSAFSEPPVRSMHCTDRGVKFKNFRCVVLLIDLKSPDFSVTSKFLVLTVQNLDTC